MRKKGNVVWTDQERALLADASLSNKEVAQALGRSISAVRVQRWLKNGHQNYYKEYGLGLRLRKPRKPSNRKPRRGGHWTVEEIAIAADYKLSDKEVRALMPHRSISAVRAYRNLNKRPGFSERKRDPYKKGHGVRYGLRNGGWTPEQLALAKDLSLDTWEVAQRIKRTRHAVSAMRRKLVGCFDRADAWKPEEVALFNSKLTNKEISRLTKRSCEAVRNMRNRRKREKAKAETDQAHLPGVQSGNAAGG